MRACVRVRVHTPTLSLSLSLSLSLTLDLALTLSQAKRESAAARIVQEEVISDLEAELRRYLASLETVIPPKEPRFLVLHSISAVGVPDADAVGGSDPYMRFILLDHDGQP